MISDLLLSVLHELCSRLVSTVCHFFLLSQHGNFSTSAILGTPATGVPR